jgi:hypothetical protein
MPRCCFALRPPTLSATGDPAGANGTGGVAEAGLERRVLARQAS